MKQSNFNIDRDCEITDIRCWKDQLRKKINCSKYDQQCWVNIKSKLPCQINNVQCWKKQLPDMPCGFHDKQCWSSLLPQLPCKITDQNCWNHLTKQHIIKNVKQFPRSNPDWDQFQNNQDKNSGSFFKPSSRIYQDQFMGMI